MKKNLLSENMKRFGTKNLNEQYKNIEMNLFNNAKKMLSNYNVTMTPAGVTIFKDGKSATIGVTNDPDGPGTLYIFYNNDRQVDIEDKLTVDGSEMAEVFDVALDVLRDRI